MTNQVLKTIKQRRSHRAYTGDEIKQEEIEAIIEAGLYAPSAHNQQTWHFTVLQHKALIDELSDAAREVFRNSENEEIRKLGQDEQFNIFYHAPVVILVSHEDGGMLPETNCSAATQNMLLAAESLDIGSCWIGFARFCFMGTHKAELIQKLHIPDGYTPTHAIALGKKKIEHIIAPERRKGTVTYL